MHGDRVGFLIGRKNCRGGIKDRGSALVRVIMPESGLLASVSSGRGLHTVTPEWLIMICSPSRRSRVVGRVLVRLELEQVAWLAVQHLANRLQRRETDGARLAGLQDRQIGKRDV